MTSAYAFWPKPNTMTNVSASAVRTRRRIRRIVSEETRRITIPSSAICVAGKRRLICCSRWQLPGGYIGISPCRFLSDETAKLLLKQDHIFMSTRDSHVHPFARLRRGRPRFACTVDPAGPTASRRWPAPAPRPGRLRPTAPRPSRMCRYKSVARRISAMPASVIARIVPCGRSCGALSPARSATSMG